MRIEFKNGRSIMFALESDEEYSWIIKEPDVQESDATWSVTCENGGFYVRTP